jgi:nucleoside-diphosphate-sugar epimerase
MPYARAKAAAEIFLRDVLRTSPIEIALLRPGIVWGPRSPHTLAIVESLLQKRAFLVDDGEGAFNSIYIDNLISCIQLCCNDRDNVCGFYNVADSEDLTWRDFYSALAPHLAYDMAKIARIPSGRFPWSVRSSIDYFQALPLINLTYHRFKARVPIALKARLKAALAGNVSYERQALIYQAAPYVDRELWHLQRTRYKLPTAKFNQRFTAPPPLSFEEGILRTIKWLSHIGLVAHEPCYAT